ncbi:unnamed protein product [Lathyrus oleraceus]
MMQCDSVRGAHAKISNLNKLYEENLELADDADDDDLQVTYYQECTLMCFLFSWLACPCLWTRVQRTSMWHTLNTSLNCPPFTSETGGRLFDILVLQAKRRLSLTTRKIVGSCTLLMTSR